MLSCRKKLSYHGRRALAAQARKARIQPYYPLADHFLKQLVIGTIALGLSACGKAPLPQAPIAVSVTPSSGSGATFSFVAVYSDPKGAGNIKSAGVLINDEVSGASACYVVYSRAKAAIGLVEDVGVGSRLLSSDRESKVENSQCTLSAKGSSIAQNGNELTLRASVEFRREFGGAKNIYLYAQNTEGGQTPLLPARGAWLIP
jgi:hypothetical protein